MSRSLPFMPIKGLLRHVIACNDLRVSRLANTLQPPMNGKTASRVFADCKPLSAPHRRSVLNFISEKLGLTVQALEAFEADPLVPLYRELLCRSVGETVGGGSPKTVQLMTRFAAMGGTARSILRFDSQLPEDLCFPADEPVVFNAPSPRIFLRRSALASFEQQHRPYWFGDQDDRDEPLENLIDQLEAGNIDLAVVEDNAVSCQTDSSGLLAAVEGLTLYDDRLLFVRWRNCQAVSLIKAEEGDAAMSVIRSVQESVENVADFLAHDAGRAPATAFLEGMLSSATWRAHAKNRLNSRRV